MKQLYFLIMILTLSFLTGCAFGNWQLYEKDNFSLFGNNTLGWGDGEYYFLSIGSPQKPFYQSAPKFSIKLPNGKIIKSTEFTLSKIKETEGIKNINVKKVAYDDYYYPSGDKFNIGCCGFSFKGEKLILFYCRRYPEWDLNIHIGTFDESHFYKLPLSLDQVEAIFGKPNRIKTKWFHPPQPSQ